MNKSQATVQFGENTVASWVALPSSGGFQAFFILPISGADITASYQALFGPGGIRMCEE
jgi:hypothetical protein